MPELIRLSLINTFLLGIWYSRVVLISSWRIMMAQRAEIAPEFLLLLTMPQPQHARTL